VPNVTTTLQQECGLKMEAGWWIAGVLNVLGVLAVLAAAAPVVCSIQSARFVLLPTSS